jgi:hypothetical protein
VVVVGVDRREQLERYGRLYGELRLAIAWTMTNVASDPDDKRPKTVTTKGWQHTRPLSDGGFGAGVFARGLKHNPVVVLRPSGLIGIECDTEEGLARIDALGLPETVTVCSSLPYKRHLWLRPSPELEQLPVVAFRFETAGLSADSERYLLCPPALHPSGAAYRFLADRAPDEIEIATMPVEAYQQLVAEHAREHGDQRETLAHDPDAKIREGRRRETIFRFACMQRRWTSSYDVIVQTALAYNAAHCEPPLTREQIESQVKGAMKMQGGQEFAAIVQTKTATATSDGPSLIDLLRTFRIYLHFPDPDLLYLNLAAVLANRMEEGDPVWLMNIGGSSRGKTELLVAFDELSDVRVVGSLTEAALLSGTPKKDRAKSASGGLLRELPAYGATLIVKDFGAVLTLPRDRRAIVMQALRDVYDGRYVRDVGTSGGLHLEWAGRLGLIAGATGALDSHGSVIAALGERWLTLRLPIERRAHGRSDEDQMARRALGGNQTRAMREVLSDTLASYFETLAPPEMRSLDEIDTELLVALSVLVTKARSPVERDPYTREIEIVPQGEGPARFVRQLHKLTLCLYAIGLDRRKVQRTIRKLALDSIMPTRRRALEVVLRSEEPMPTSTIAMTIGLPTKTTRRVLEDLAAHRLVEWRKTSDAGNATHEWWASELTLDLWRRCAYPLDQAESRGTGMSLSPLLRERPNVERDFSVPQREWPGDANRQLDLDALDNHFVKEDLAAPLDDAATT